MNAIILAAGIGSRLSQLTKRLPKSMLKINGVPIIERQIIFLKETGINEIIVVSGYMAEHFLYLEHMYGVKLVYNQHYAEFNNLYSLYLAKDFLGNSYILDGDIYLVNNFLKRDLSASTYFTGPKSKVKDEWLLKFYDNKLYDITIYNNLDKIQQDSITMAYIMSGVSYWSISDGRLIREYLSRMFNEKNEFIYEKHRNYYWDHIIYENLKEFSIEVVEIQQGDWHEIDTITDFLSILK